MGRLLFLRVMSRKVRGCEGEAKAARPCSGVNSDERERGPKGETSLGFQLLQAGSQALAYE